MTQSCDGVFAADEGKQDAAVGDAEEVETLVVASSIRLWLGDLVEVLRTDRWVVDGVDELEVSAVRGSGKAPQVTEAVDGLLEGSELEFSRAVPVFHRPVVPKKGNVVGRGFDAQDPGELVVHLDGGWTHVVADACALNAGVEVVTEFGLEAGGEPPAEKGGHLLGFHRVDGCADDGLVQRPERFAALEDDVGRLGELSGIRPQASARTGPKGRRPADA